jgi:hypothetical protein
MIENIIHLIGAFLITLMIIILFIGTIQLIHSADIYYEKSAQYIDFKMSGKKND